MDKKKCTVIVLSAGQGKRMGTAIQKQYIEISGKPIIFYTLDAFQKSAIIDDIVLVVGEGQPQGALFLAQLPSTTPPQRLEGKRYLVLDGVQDPGNVGTIWRSADALGADGLLLVNGCADPYSPKVVRATMGACFRLPVWETTVEELEGLLKTSQIPLYATALREDTVDVRRADLGRAAVVIGSEGRGVSQALLDRAEQTVKIPMRERCESLNAASAAVVVLWEMGK